MFRCVSFRFFWLVPSAIEDARPNWPRGSDARDWASCPDTADDWFCSTRHATAESLKSGPVRDTDSRISPLQSPVVGRAAQGRGQAELHYAELARAMHGAAQHGHALLRAQRNVHTGADSRCTRGTPVWRSKDQSSCLGGHDATKSMGGGGFYWPIKRYLRSRPSNFCTNCSYK